MKISKIAEVRSQIEEVKTCGCGRIGRDSLTEK
jgi:hypothetical protein